MKKFNESSPAKADKMIEEKKDYVFNCYSQPKSIQWKLTD